MKQATYARLFWHTFDLKNDPNYIIPNAVQCIAIYNSNACAAIKPDTEEVQRAYTTISTAVRHGALTWEHYRTALRYWGLVVDPCNCNLCTTEGCIHRDAFRRLPHSAGGLGLCPNLEK